MATMLFKLVIDASTITNVDINPEVVTYFYELDPAHRTDDILTIPSTAFTDGDGNNVADDLITVIPDNGYYLLFINGVLQQSSLYSVTATQVTINDASTIPVGAPITLVVNNFDPTATSNTTVTT